MFTIDIVLGVLKKVFGSVFSFLWEYKGWILLGVVIIALYIRGNNYKEDYNNEVVSRIETTVKYDKQLADIRLANETALRIAQEKSAANYKALVEKTSLIQEEYNNREKDINATITELNSSNNSLHQSIKDFTKRSTDSSQGSVSDSTTTKRLQLTGELLQSCVEEQDYLAIEADRLNNSVVTLQDWGNKVIEQSEGEKDE